MKMAIGHAVPLSPFALDILRSLPRFAGSNYVFTARGNRPLNDFGTVKSRMDTRITVLNGGRPIEHWTFHDTRRLVRSTMSRLRIDSDAAEAVLAHRKRGIRATYDLYDLLAEKRRALEVWSAHLASIVEPSSAANVVEIPLRQATRRAEM